MLEIKILSEYTWSHMIEIVAERILINFFLEEKPLNGSWKCESPPPPVLKKYILKIISLQKKKINLTYL